MSGSHTELLRTFPLLRSASPDTIDALVVHAAFTSLAHGEMLWHEGAVPTHLCLLRRGLVEVVRLTAGGVEVDLAIFGPRECPGLFAALDGRRYPADARVLSEVAEVVTVPRALLLECVAADPALERAMSTVLRQHNAVLREKVDVLTAGEVPQRLATLFIVLCERFGDEGADGELTLPIVLSRRVLARLVGARTETVIRVLSKWDKERFVCTSETGFVVRDARRLHAEAAG